MKPEDAARWLAEAWETGHPLAALPEEMTPRDIAAGEDIAAALVEALGHAVCGLRLAPGPDGTMLAGVVFQGRLVQDGTVLPAGLLRHARISLAVIGVLAAPLEEDGTTAPVFAALHPALDLSASRFTEAPDNAAVVAADLAGLGHVVVGPRAALPDGTVEVALAEGRKRPRGVAVDVLAALGAVAREARRLGGLPAGAVLVAAGLTPGVEPVAGTDYVARMGPLGRARIGINPP